MGLPAEPIVASSAGSTPADGGLEITTIDLGSRIACKCPERQARHRPADLGGEIASTHADAVRDAFAQRGESRDDGLQPGAGGGHAADPPPRHDVGEAEADATEIGRAAVRPHAQKPLRGGQALELDFFVEAARCR